MSTEKNLNNLVINKVESQEVYNYMKANSLINEDELYLVEGENEIAITEATETESGLMSASDKVKLNGIEDGANKTIVDSTLSSTSGNPVQNKVINSKFDEIKVSIDSKVPSTRTVNGKNLSSNITLNASDVGALPNTTQIPSIDGLATETYVDNKVAGLSGAMHFIGKVDTLPKSVSGYKSGDVILVGTKEYVCDGSKWVELGDEGIYALKSVTIGTQSLAANIDLPTLATDMGLGDLAYKSSATGTVAGQTISGVKATGNSAGTINVALTQTATAASLGTKSQDITGDVTGTVVAKGSVGIAKNDAGTQISGTVSAPTITVTPATDSIKKVTSVGTLPTKAADTFSAGTLPSFTQGAKAQWSASVDNNGILSFSFTANGDDKFIKGTLPSYTEGTFTQGTLPTLATTATPVVTGITKAEASAPVFTGDKFAATFTGSSANISATFAGDSIEVVDSVTYDKAAVDTAKTKFNPAAIELAVGDIAVAAKNVTVK